MGMTMTAAFYESYLRTVGSLPMRLMGVAIIELKTMGEGELADDLIRIRERWAKAISQRAKQPVASERLQHVADVIKSSLLGTNRPALQFTLSEARKQARSLGVDAAPREVLDA